MNIFDKGKIHPKLFSCGERVLFSLTHPEHTLDPGHKFFMGKIVFDDFNRFFFQFR